MLSNNETQYSKVVMQIIQQLHHIWYGSFIEIYIPLGFIKPDITSHSPKYSNDLDSTAGFRFSQSAPALNQ